MPRLSFLSPFRQRSFRFQWPADLATSWAFEMETLILGWFVLTETGSVVWLAAFGALQLTGTLVSPIVGVMGDRLGQRRLLVAMRACYAVLATLMAALAFAGALTVTVVLVIVLLSGLLRPSDIGMRNALIGATMPAPYLTAALGIERTSADAARVAGALSGATVVAWLGIGPAYLVVVGLYLTSLALLRGVAGPGPPAGPPATHGLGAVWFDLGAGFVHVRERPALLAAICLAFLANFAAYPLSGGLLPHVARDVYGLDETGLGKLAASFAAGALVGSLMMVARGGALRPGRTMGVAALIWFGLLLAYATVRTPLPGMALLFLIGLVQSFCMVPMSVLLLRVSQPAFRGRVMGVRILAVYGMAIGLPVAGLLVARIGFAATAALFAAGGLLWTVAILVRWRADLWRPDAPANLRSRP